ncbi:MAG: putative colanic acid biosynthesis acetyltransferase WcaF, partial [Polaribacter sp.]
MPTDLSSYNKQNYHPGRNKLVVALWYVINHLLFKSAFFPFSKIKISILRLFGATIGKGVNLKPFVSIKYPWHLTIGDHCWIGEGVWIDNLVEVKLEDNVCISQGAMLLTGNHDYSKISFDLMTGKIVLESGVWVGAKAIVGPGVRAGSHMVLSAGSVAGNDLKAYGIYQGNPAVWKRE